MNRSIQIGLCALGAIIIIAIIAVLVSNNVASKDSTNENTSCSDNVKNSVLGRYTSAAISSDATPCAQIAKDILLRNGTAADAAVAGMFCVGVINAQSCGLGGGFTAIYYSKKENKVYTLDALARAPMLAYKDMYKPELNHSAYTRIRLEKYFKSIGKEFNFEENKNRWWEESSLPSKKGGLSIAVPGQPAGLYELYLRFGGNVPWKDLIEPTIKICEEGYNLTWYTGRQNEIKGEQLLAEPSMRMFVNKKENRALKEGDMIQRKQLASTLRELQLNPRALNEGHLASKLVEDILNYGGIILENDLKTYRPIWKDPVKVHLRNGNFTVYSLPPPSSGILVGLLLNILDEFQLDEKNLSEQETERTQQLFSEAMKFTFAKKYKLADLNATEAESVWMELASDELALKIKNKFSESKTSQDPLFYGAKLFEHDDAGTAHLSIVAPNGDAVGVTSTINYLYGSGVRSKQTGIILNNKMRNFNTPQSLISQDTLFMPDNFIEPGKRPVTSMSPTLIMDNDGNVRLIIGASGGTKIPTTLALTIARNLWMKQDLKEAIDACRIHHKLIPMVLEYEMGFPEEEIENLKSKGHVTQQFKFKSIVQGVAVYTDSGILEANSDYRKSGEVDGF